MALPRSLIKQINLRLKKKGKEEKIPYKEFTNLVDKIQEKLGITERQLIHRYIAKATGITTRSILRYDKGEICYVPNIVMAVASELLRKIENDELIVLYRGNEERPVVLRKQFNKLVDSIIESGLYPSRSALLKIIEKRFGLKKGKLCRIYRNNGVQLVDKRYYDALLEIYEQCEYDPSKIYKIGDRIRHPSFGTGQVIKKLSKDKIVVRFSNGEEKILRENLKEDPYRIKLNGVLGFSISL